MRRRRLAMVVAAMTVLATACNNSTPHNKVVTSANPVRSAADLNCTLPIRAGNQLGFVDFPSGIFRVDATVPDANQNIIYTHGARKWVQEEPGLAQYRLSPDETQIATFDEPITGAGHVPPLYIGVALVDLKTNKSHHIATLPGPGISILGYLPDGIYVFGRYVYRVDPATGKVTTITPNPPTESGFYFWVTPTAAWSSLIPEPNQGDKDSVRSISLSDGSVTTWYTAPATRSVSILGFLTPDEPLVAEYNTEPYTAMTGVSFMLLTRPGTAETLSLNPDLFAYGWTDSFGIWLTSPGHLWLYDTAGLNPMASVPVDLNWRDSLNGLFGIAGFCR